MASVAEALSPGSPREDVAHVVAAALDPRTRFQGTLRRHWARDINAAETARQISLLVGRELRYEDESVAEGRKWRNILGAPDWEVDTWLGSYEAIAVGELDAVSDTVQQFTGVQPFSLSQYFGKHPVFLNKLRQVLNGRHPFVGTEANRAQPGMKLLGVCRFP